MVFLTFCFNAELLLGVTKIAHVEILIRGRIGTLCEESLAHQID